MPINVVGFGRILAEYPFCYDMKQRLLQMAEQFSRTELLIGKEAVKKLNNSRVAVFGVGGVGGYVCEALARAGIGAFDLVDNDIVSESNLNRQIIATWDSIGKPKVEVMKERILSINPKADVRTFQMFFLPENAKEFPFSDYDYIVDAVDTVTAKIEIIMNARANHVPVISAMGAGNKIDPTKFVVTDIFKTKMDPLARVMRHEMKKRGVNRLKVVYSEEQAMTPKEKLLTEGNKVIPGSMSFVPGAAGLIIAGEVVKDLIKGTD